jgi:hypothetical protein
MSVEPGFEEKIIDNRKSLFIGVSDHDDRLLDDLEMCVNHAKIMYECFIKKGYEF